MTKKRLSTLLFETGKFKRVVQKVPKWNYSFILDVLALYCLDHLVDDLEMFAGIAFIHGEVFERFKVLINQA